jgi:hypothetical protein
MDSFSPLLSFFSLPFSLSLFISFFLYPSHYKALERTFYDDIVLQIDTLPIQQSTTTCPGTLFRLTDGDAVSWFYCASADSSKRLMSMVSTTNVVLMESSSTSTNVPTLVVTYQAEPVPDVVHQCPYGSISFKAGQQCLTIVDETLNWDEAEDYCAQNGGHLVSIDSHRTQTLIDTALINR